MLHAASARARLIGLVLAAATLVAAVPVPVQHHADHADEAVHLEHDHGGHGGLVEQTEARVPAPDGPAAIRTGAVELPGTRRTAVDRPSARGPVSPLGRAPPPDLPRAPPHAS